MKRPYRVDPIPEGLGYQSNQVPQQGYYKTLPAPVQTILFYPDSEFPTLIGINSNPNADIKSDNWTIYSITYNPSNPSYYTSIVVTIGTWALVVP